MTNKVTVIGKTVAGKEIGYRMCAKFPTLYEVVFASGGEQPADFKKPKWSHLRPLKAAVEAYLEQDKKKADQKAEEEAKKQAELKEEVESAKSKRPKKSGKPQ